MKNTVLSCFLLLPIFALAQKNPPFNYSEQPDDPYIHVPRAGRATSPPYRLNGTAFSIRQVNVDDAGQNILGDAANEPSLVIDPLNPGRMAVGWRQFDTISSNFCAASSNCLPPLFPPTTSKNSRPGIRAINCIGDNCCSANIRICCPTRRIAASPVARPGRRRRADPA